MTVFFSSVAYKWYADANVFMLKHLSELQSVSSFKKLLNELFGSKCLSIYLSLKLLFKHLFIFLTKKQCIVTQRGMLNF